ncbi:predicted protein [Chaetoceros tenuissimus]|uniref:Uncharacterized protein n=1 Tax=Chaetoceros tenuissimus TaxID=426638 RepID=A0AAD3CYW9_9STRA|nr:predicted protein [Chaetoceros tenuissimus]
MTTSNATNLSTVQPEHFENCHPSVWFSKDANTRKWLLQTWLTELGISRHTSISLTTPSSTKEAEQRRINELFAIFRLGDKNLTEMSPYLFLSSEDHAEYLQKRGKRTFRSGVLKDSTNMKRDQPSKEKAFPSKDKSVPRLSIQETVTNNVLCVLDLLSGHDTKKNSEYLEAAIQLQTQPKKKLAYYHSTYICDEFHRYNIPLLHRKVAIDYAFEVLRGDNGNVNNEEHLHWVLLKNLRALGYDYETFWLSLEYAASALTPSCNVLAAAGILEYMYNCDEEMKMNALNAAKEQVDDQNKLDQTQITNADKADSMKMELMKERIKELELEVKKLRGEDFASI